jgi:hypothetical protein
MNCNFCGCGDAYIAHKVKRKVVAICGDCWYQEMKYVLRREKVNA